MNKTYENNMADQDVVVHSLRVLSEIKNPALTQLKRDLGTQQASAKALALKQDKFYKSLSDDGIISPMEKKIVLREMESIANSYTALYTQAVAEHYDTAPFFTDYMATYAALRNYLYSDLHLFDNIDEETQVDRDEFNTYFSNYYYSESTAIVSMTVGVITELGFKVLTSLEDEGEEGQVGIYHGSLYQYTDGEWKILDRELYYGKSETLPPVMEGRYFLCTKNVLLNDILYVNDEPLELNGEMLEVGTDYEKGIIYVYENHHWQRKEPEEDYRYLVAVGDYYSIKNKLPDILKEEVATISRQATNYTYFGALASPPPVAAAGDYFLYAGTSSGIWVYGYLYQYNGSLWEQLDQGLVKNQKYYMAALQDILSITETTNGYFNTVFCNSFFSNIAALNELSTKVIYLQEGGVLKSIDYDGEQGLLIDAEGNIDAMGSTHIGGECIIDGDAIYRGSIESGALQLYNTPSAIAEVIADTSTQVHTFISNLELAYFFAGTIYKPDSYELDNNNYTFIKYENTEGSSAAVTRDYYYKKEEDWIGGSSSYPVWYYRGYHVTTTTTNFTLRLYYGNDESNLSYIDILYTKIAVTRQYFTTKKYTQNEDPNYSLVPESSIPKASTTYNGNCTFTADITRSVGEKTLRLVGLPPYSAALPQYTVYVDDGVLKIKTD